jgi:type III restriction enzyme
MDPDVKDDINRKAKETEPLPDLIYNAYYLLGKDWLETKQEWELAGQTAPPAMITVANRTETSARIRYSFDHKQILIDELCNPEKTLHIDSKVLKEAESSDEGAIIDFIPDESGEIKLTKKQQAELLRQKVDTVGKIGQPGEQVQNVISVGMLSEGWDAKTVTHMRTLYLSAA